MRVFLVLLVACLGACPQPVPPSTTSARGSAVTPAAALARPGSPWPAGAPACVVVQAAPSSAVDCSALGADIGRAPGAPPFARFESTYGRGQIAWSHLPVLGDAHAKPSARVDARDGGLHVHGFAPLGAQMFSLRRRVEIVHEHLWLLPDHLVRVLGTTGDHVAVSVDTPFVAPHTYEAEVPCDAFGAPDATETSRGLPTQPPYAAAKGSSLTIFGAPSGPELFTVTLDPSDVLAWLGVQGDFVHVATFRDGASALAVDGWVRSAEVDHFDHHNFDRDFGDCGDSTDACVLDRTTRETSVFVGAAGPEGEAVGTLDANTHVIFARGFPTNEKFVAFLTSEQVIVATRENALWVARADLTHDGSCEP